MSEEKGLVSKSSLTGIADAIRAKNGGTATYKPADMAAAIKAITTGGGSDGPDPFILFAYFVTPGQDGAPAYSDTDPGVLKFLKFTHLNFEDVSKIRSTLTTPLNSNSICSAFAIIPYGYFDNVVDRQGMVTAPIKPFFGIEHNILSIIANSNIIAQTMLYVPNEYLSNYQDNTFFKQAVGAENIAAFDA